MSKRPRPTPTGLAALEPQPMSPAAIADLVTRVRLATIDADRRTPEVPVSRWQPISATRCAARYVHLASCSYREAAQAFGLRHLRSIRDWHRRYYPGELAARAPYGGGPTTFRIGLRAPRERFLAGALCAICTGPCTGELRREPLGRNGAQVNVCIACRTEVPRERDHLFGGSSRGVGVGEGNRHTRAR